MIGTLNIAHRGASAVAPENTMAAFAKAVEMGAGGIELDVRLSKDNFPVVMHDQDLDRTTTGHGPVNELTCAELKALDAGSWYSAEFKGEKIPTLEEVFNRFKSCNLLFNVELKKEIDDDSETEKAVIAAIVKNNLEERTLISSFNQDSLQACHKINPAIRTGLLYLTEVTEPWHYARSLGCYSVHPLFYYLQSPELLAGFKAHNIPLYPWTVNDPEQMKYLTSEGIEAIITDYPDILRDILEGKQV